MKKILITGANSYIGDSVRDYLLLEPDNYSVDVKDTIGWNPHSLDFHGYDVVFNVAGIAHVRETDENRNLYYDINRDLAVRIARAAKEGGANQFILLSTMSVYGVIVGQINKETPVHPINAYGKSKAEADDEISKLEGDDFRFCCLRPPMVYGKNCKGNYQSLRKFAMKSPIFPKYKNQRSMIYIGNLCEFIKQCIDEQRTGLFFPQDAEYVNTSEIVKMIADCHGKKICLTKAFNCVIKIAPLKVMKKVFGSLTYEKEDLVSKYDFKESIRLTEE